MIRLPGYDPKTRRSELAAFCSLGLVALMLILVAMSDAGQFAENREAIIAALSGGAPTSRESSVQTNVAVTGPQGAPNRGMGIPQVISPCVRPQS